MDALPDINSAWGDFCHGVQDNTAQTNAAPPVDGIAPRCSDIYISTKTKIAYLNQSVALSRVFWELPILNYHEVKEGIVKKQMKFNSTSEDELNDVLHNVPLGSYNEQYVITHITNPGGRITFKDVRKISIGLCKKDIISYRGKQKGAFYNCFVVILRVKFNGLYREIHVKVFNTGKLEIPGIQTDALLHKVLQLLITTLNDNITMEKEFAYLKDKCSTVLINSNFTCGYYLDREKLYNILKTKYRINCSYDSCSYPGIQCEFYYDSSLEKQTGQQTGQRPKGKTGKLKSKLMPDESNTVKVSFMIFRTGSALIVGKCTEHILNVIYLFLCDILATEFPFISCGLNESNGNTTNRKKVHKKRIQVTV
jgi:hypothetical protein